MGKHQNHHSWAIPSKKHHHTLWRKRECIHNVILPLLRWRACNKAAAGRQCAECSITRQRQRCQGEEWSGMKKWNHEGFRREGVRRKKIRGNSLVQKVSGRIPDIVEDLHYYQGERNFLNQLAVWDFDGVHCISLSSAPVSSKSQEATKGWGSQQ